MPSNRPWGLIVAVCLLGLIEAWMHTDDFLYRYRSVFAAGRAFDKLRFVENNSPSLLLLGDSRTDNGFDPHRVAPNLAQSSPPRVFNLGIPGSNACDHLGIINRLNNSNRLSISGISHVVLVLDEALFQSDLSMGYYVFFADREMLWRQQRYPELLASWFRLWGYRENLKSLKEPEKLIRFAKATIEDLEPVGGGAREHLGYRAGIREGFQNQEQILRQEVGSLAPPNPSTVECFWELIDQIRSQDVEVAYTFPPMLNRRVLFLEPESAVSHPYREIHAELNAKNISFLQLDTDGSRSASEFVNAGHLADTGAQRFSRELNRRLQAVWPNLVSSPTP